MNKRQNKKGICKLCGDEKKLSFEHVPPRVAYNKTTRYYSFPQKDYYESKNILNFKPKGKIFQGGIGYHSLCEKCNNFLGFNYVRPFSSFVNIGMNFIFNYDFDFLYVKIDNQNPFRILKQIASMFISISDLTFSKMYPEFVEFVINPDKRDLSNRFRFYLYLNNEGHFRKYGFPTFTNFHGFICELTYPPFGYVLNIDNEFCIDHLTEITHFKNFIDNSKNEIELGLHKYPTHIHMPLDFRKKEEIPKE